MTIKRDIAAGASLSEALGKAPTSDDLLRLYTSGDLMGIKPGGAFHSIAYRTRTPRFYDAFPEAIGIGAGKVVTPYKAALVIEPEFGRMEAQTEGDCVSHSTRNAGSIDWYLDIMFGETLVPSDAAKPRLCTENTYGMRGWPGPGAWCSTLAEYVGPSGAGGFLVRKRYDEADLSSYNGSIGARWGGSGTPASLNRIAAGNKAERVFACKSLEEARDAIAYGFGVSMCSQKGFRSTRNADGLCEQSGSWAHAMAWVGMDDTDWAHQKYGGMLPLVQNSWGVWNSGPKRHEQPDGSFWIRPSVASSMVSGGGGWIIASVQGYDRIWLRERAEAAAKQLSA